MNNQAGTVCRLCSRAVICFSDFDRIEEVTKQMLDVLFLKFNWTISKNPVMCNKCATKLQECFDFKSACVGTTNSKSSCVKSTDVHLEEGCLKTEKVEFDVFEAKKSCRFCDKLTESGCLIHLLETKENMFIADMLPKHFPELNLNITEDLVSCETCLESLQRVYSFITKCLYVEENMKNCIEMDDTEGENHIPDNTQKFELKSCDESGASSTNVVVKAEINSEESASSDSEVGLGAKIEEVNIKMEPEENERLQEDDTSSSRGESKDDPIDSSNITQNIVPEVAYYKCDVCTYKSTNKKYFKSHVKKHTVSSETVIMHKCPICPFTTKRKDTLSNHELTHKDCSEVPIYKCEFCTYETKFRRNITRHMAKHHKAYMVKRTDLSEITTIHKCPICPFTTKRKDTLSNHELTHKDCSEVAIYKCELCTYETKFRRNITRHMSKHKPEETSAHKCEICEYKTKYKSALTNHMLTHKDRTEVTMYKCDRCPFETRYKISFKRHTHHNINPYKCEKCAYETKIKSALVKHVQTHLTTLPLYKCTKCFYDTKREYALYKHMLKHKEKKN